MKISTFKYFYPERPGLIHIEQGLFGRLSDSPAWIAEPKFNGSRLQLHRLPSGTWELWNRHQEKFSWALAPEVAAALAALPLGEGYHLFDGELRHNKTKGVRNQIVLYDCFIFGGELLTGKTFEDRRHILDTLTKYGAGDDRIVSMAPQYPGNFRAVFDELTPDPEIEGLVLKNLGGKLALGRNRAVNSVWMLKVRKPNNSYHF
jgi:ATP-dependent DNA ligase